MNQAPKPRLRRQLLTELTTDEYAAVHGGTRITTVLSCFTCPSTPPQTAICTFTNTCGCGTSGTCGCTIATISCNC